MNYFAEPYNHPKNNKIIYYATKSDFKNATGVDTFKFVEKTNLSNLKWEVVKLDVIN